MKLLYLVMLANVFWKEVGVSIKLKQNVKKSLDSVEGFASFKTMQSVKLINWNFKRDCGNLKLYEYKTVNLLNCVTLDTEHFHASSQFKPPSLRYLEYEEHLEVSSKNP